MPVPALLAALVSACVRRAGAVLLAGLVIGALAAWFAAGHLGVTTNIDQMFSSDLAWRQREAEFAKLFPQFQDQLVAVVDARTPEEAEATAAGLAAALQQDKAHFRSVTRPDASPFFAREGLLFLDQKELSEVLNKTIDAQPFLGQLVADPTARGLFQALSLVAMGVQQGQADLTAFAPALEGFHRTLQSVLQGHPVPLSWQSLLGGSLSEKAGPYRFVLAQPHVDFNAIQPGGVATAALRAAAAKLPFVQSGQAHVRVTGSVALSDEEFATVAQGAVWELVGSTLLVTLWLFLAVKSWRLIGPILLTLGLGLVLTTGFAALAVGQLNLISVAFAILFVGIAVDFAIQFSVRFRDLRLHLPDNGTALQETGRRAGAQILVAAAATAAGFLAFVPTSFTGVAELGIVAGVGMLIAFACTLTFLPAALALFRPRGEAREVGFAWGPTADAAMHRAHRPILAGALVLAVLGAALVPGLTFDADPLHTKNPDTEAMRTLHDLMQNPVTNPYSAEILAPSAEKARTIAEALRKQPLVQQVTTIESFIPDDQQPKLALIADAAGILGPTLDQNIAAAPITPADLRLAVRTAAGQIGAVMDKVKQGGPLAQLEGDLKALETAPDATLLAANAALTRFLPDEITQLRLALQAEPVTLQSISKDIARDWLLPDGRARVQAMPKPQADNSAGLHAFAAEVRSVAPDATGPAITIVDTSATIVGAFRNAAIYAVVAIALILFVALRRVAYVALVMAPLLLSALLTVVVMVLGGLWLNFANIIALPLLLGVGVSFNIYFVMNWGAGLRQPLASATARAVFFSALTTGTAFGSLALSAHPGTASMGDLLLLSLGCTLVATFVFVPAMLASLKPRPPAF